MTLATQRLTVAPKVLPEKLQMFFFLLTPSDFETFQGFRNGSNPESLSVTGSI